MEYDSNIRNVIERIVIAYNVKTIKEIADLMNVSASVIGNRIHRESFPHDLVLRCALDTGANLLWLCTGEGEAGIEGFQPVKKIVLSDDMLEKLERLTALKEKGSITEQEFNLLKGNLMS